MSALAARLNAKLYRIFVALLIIYAVLTGFGPMLNQVDLGWQIAQGRWMVQHASLYAHDAFNYPNLGRPIINEYPLFELVLYAATGLGWWGPCLLAATGYGGIIILLARAADRLRLRISTSFALALGIMFLYFQIAFPLRPHLVTYLGVAALGSFLLIHREETRWTRFWPMALLQVAWTNCHSGFVFGPALAGLFGAEMVLRTWRRDGVFPTAKARTWLTIFVLLLLACLINPSGWNRFYPPFFQDQLESIRAYVGEMEPLGGGAAVLVTQLTLIALVVVSLAVVLNRGAISFAFLVVALDLFIQAQSIMKAWPILGIFAPLLLLSSAAFASSPPKSSPVPGVFALFAATALAAVAVVGRLNPALDSSVTRQWHQFNHGRCEMATDAVAWMKSRHITGCLFNRCEDGGILQQEDFTETFADTGFGKYDEAFIHEVGLVNERPAVVPRLLAAHRPDYIVCGNFCFLWPSYLRESGWRLIYYSPNSLVWTRPETRPDLPSVSRTQVTEAFAADLKSNGLPAPTLLGRNLIALNSLGLEDFAFAQLAALPAAMHHAPWYWEAARIMCFGPAPFSDSHRDELWHEAEGMKDDALTADFRAYRAHAVGDGDGAWRILHALPPRHLSNAAAELLLRLSLDRNLPEALALARRTDCFDLRNGKHWQYLAQAEELSGWTERARLAWQKAVFYYPDDEALMRAAAAFAARDDDPALKQAIAASTKIYGR